MGLAGIRGRRGRVWPESGPRRGDPTILGRKGRNLLQEELVSPVFIFGYLETEKPKQITHTLNALRKEIMNDPYFHGIPSLSSTRHGFHANKECPEVRERVFRALQRLDLKVHMVVARKDLARFRKKFDLKAKRLYGYLVSKLFENRLHLYQEIDIYFAEMGNTVREQNMRAAIEQAMESFRRKWGRENENTIRCFIQPASNMPQLQAIDYMVWSVYRAYTAGEFRFYNFMRNRISLVLDIFDEENYPNNYYTSKNPLTREKPGTTRGPSGG